MNTHVKLVSIFAASFLLGACGNSSVIPVPDSTVTALPSSSIQAGITAVPSSHLSTNLSMSSPEVNSEQVSEFSFDSQGKVKTIEKTTFGVRQGFALAELVNDSTGCGTNLTQDHFANVLKMYAPTDKATEYHFVYNGASQRPSEWVVTTMPNKPHYQSLDDFKKDFDICDGGASRYPFLVSADFVLFVSSCGTGLSDGSGLPNGCQEIQDAVGPTIKLNFVSAPITGVDSSSPAIVPVLYRNTEYQFSLDFGGWGQPKVNDVTATYKSLMPIKAAYSFTAAQDSDKVLTVYVVPVSSNQDPAIVDAPMVSIKQNASYAFYYSSSGDNTGAPEMEDAKWDAIYKEAKTIVKTFKFL